MHETLLADGFEDYRASLKTVAYRQLVGRGPWVEAAGRHGFPRNRMWDLTKLTSTD